MGGVGTDWGWANKLGGAGPLGMLTGSAGGAGGTGFAKAQTPSIAPPVTAGQVNDANAGAGGALASQNALVAALNGAGAAGNQQQAFGQGQTALGQIGDLGGTGIAGSAVGQQHGLNTGLAGLGGAGLLGQAAQNQGALTGSLASSGGVGAQMQGVQGLLSVLGQQQATAGQLQGIANGTGPNPAQAMLNSATGQNIANQAALMAGQRGAGANVGLMARQAAQQGAATQQQAVGQAATMQAQQQLNALGQMGAQQQAMAGVNQGLVGAGQGLTAQQQAAISAGFGQGAGIIGAQQTGIGQEFAQGAGIIGAGQAQQGINAGIAQGQVGNALGGQNAATQAHLANVGQQMGALGAYNTNQVNAQGNVNTANTSLANTAMQGQQAMLGGLLSGAGSAMEVAGARGGMVRRPMAEGGDTGPAPNGQGPLAPPAAPGPAGTGPEGGMGPLASAQPAPGPQSSFGQFLSGVSGTGQYLAQQPIEATPQASPPDTAGTAQIPAPPDMGYGSKMLYQGSQKASKAGLLSALGARGGLAAGGGSVQTHTPSQHATRPGNSYANDKVPAMLSEGEVVIPRDVMQAPDPAAAAADFVSRVIARRGKAS